MKEGREIFRRPGHPESKEDLAKREGVPLEMQQRFREVYPEFYQIIEKFDFPYLKERYGDIARRSGINPRTINFLGANNFIPVPQRPARQIPGRLGRMMRYTQEGRGSYDLDTNVGHINWPMMREMHGNKEEIQWLLPFHLLRTFIHEETHAVSKGVCTAFDEEAGKYREKQTGYEQWSTADRERGGEYFFKRFDEGVVEKLSQEILLDYLKNARDSNFDVTSVVRFLEWHKENPELKSYVNEIKMVEVFTKLISKFTSVPDTEELVQKLEKKISPTFIDRIKLLYSR